MLKNEELKAELLAEMAKKFPPPKKEEEKKKDPKPEGLG